MIDITTERLLTIEEAAKLSKASFPSVWRWILKGLPGPNGECVRLRAQRLGRKWVTSAEALQEFSLALTPRIDGELARPFPRPSTKRNRGSEKAAAELERVGF